MEFLGLDFYRFSNVYDNEKADSFSAKMIVIYIKSEKRLYHVLTSAIHGIEGMIDDVKLQALTYKYHICNFDWYLTFTSAHS